MELAFRLTPFYPNFSTKKYQYFVFYANFCYSERVENILAKTERVLRLRNYSAKTCQAYLLYIRDYISFSKKTGIKNKQTAIEEFLLSKQKRGQSPQTINLALHAVKFFYAEVLKDSQKIPLKFVKKNKKLPIVLSNKEIHMIIEATANAKYKLMISLAYACGLRVSELTNLKAADLDIDELVVHIKESKGKKDRLSVLPEKLQNDLRNLIAGKNSNDFIFESNRGAKLTTTSLQKMFRKSLALTKISKPATFHSLKTFLCYTLIRERNRCEICSRTSRA